MKQHTLQRRRGPKDSCRPTSHTQVSVLSCFNAPAAAIAVGASDHQVAMPADREARPIRRLGTLTTEIYAIAQWLEQCAIPTVVRESPGIDGMPLLEVLEKRGLEVKLVDTHHVKHVPGCKTDVRDCQWRQALHRYGVRRGACWPEDQVGVWRRSLRQREGLIGDTSRSIQQMHKALAQMQVQVTEVVSNITGKTGMTIISLSLAGAREAKTLARRRGRRAK